MMKKSFYVVSALQITIQLYRSAQNQLTPSVQFSQASQVIYTRMNEYFSKTTIFEGYRPTKKAYITEGSRVVSYLNTNSARWCLTSLFEMGRGGSTIVWT